MEDDTIFCPSCGRKVGAEPVAATAPPFSSAFRPAGSLDGCDSGTVAPVVEKKPAAAQADTALRFSPSYKHKSSVPSFSSSIANAEQTVSVRKSPASYSGTPSYIEPGVEGNATDPKEASNSCALPKIQHEEAAQAEQHSTKQVCPESKSNKPSAIGQFVAKTQQIEQTINKKVSSIKYLYVGILAVIAILIGVFFIAKAQSPWFEVNSAGKLSFDLDTWKFYHFYNSSASVEIPQKYDGTIKNISANSDLPYHTLRYAGDLNEFLTAHSWAITMMREHGRGKVECRDYIFSYDKDGHGAVFIEDADSRYVVTGNYSISNKRGDTILFESWSQMRRWLDTGIYEYSWTDYYGNTHYDNLNPTLD